MTVVAITGSTGFLGTATVRRFRSIPGIELKLLRRVQVDGHDLEQVVVGDLADPDACGRLVADADVVVHLAGLVRSTDDAALHHVNVEGTRQVVRAANAAGVSRFVLVSSAGIYGHPGNRVDEKSPFRPESEYERSKAIAEQAATDEWSGAGLVVVQPSNVIGVGHPLRPLRRFLAQINVGRPFIHGGGWANYVGVDDVARVLVAAANADNVPTRIIVNVPLRLGELADLAQQAVGRNVRSIELPGLVGRILGPLLLAASRREPRVDRVAALFGGTHFATLHSDWFESQGITLELSAVLRDMAVSYGIGSES